MGICDGVPSSAALVHCILLIRWRNESVVFCSLYFACLMCIASVCLYFYVSSYLCHK